MSKLQLFRVFLNERLTAAAVEILGEVEKTVVEYQEENDRLRRLLRITPEIQLCKIDSLQLSVSEQLQGLFDTKDSIFTPSFVKSECDQKDPCQEAILAEYPTLSPLKTSKLQSFCVFLNECLTASAAVEIFGEVVKTVAEYQEENDRLRRLLRITPEIKLCRIDSLQLSLSVSEEEVPPEQQHCEQEWSPSLGQEDPEPTQIKEEQEELRTNQEEEQLQVLFDTKDSMFTPSCVKSEYDQEDPLQSLTLPKTQTVENRESYPKPKDLTSFGTVTHLKGLKLPCDSPNNQNNASSHSSAVSSDTVGLDSSPPLDLNPQMGEPCTCPFCGKNFKQKGHLSMHMRIHTGEKPFSCGDCGKSFIQKGDLRRHILTHTGEKPFSCNFCCKSFSQKGDLRRHILTHTGEKPHGCSVCGRTFIRKAHLLKHVNNVHKERKQDEN